MFFITAFAQGSSSADRPLSNLRQLFAEFRNVQTENRRRRAVADRVRRELNSYSDRELNDLGISRFDIERLARDAAV